MASIDLEGKPVNKAKMLALSIGLLLATSVISVAGWQLGWWLEGKNVDKRVQIQNRNTGTQTAWSDEARNAIADYELTDPANTAARGALRNKACNLTGRLSDVYLTDDLLAFQSKECG